MDTRSQFREWLLADLGGAPLHVETAGDPMCEAEIRSKSEGVLAGAAFLPMLFDESHRLLSLDGGNPPAVEALRRDGEAFSPGEVLARVKGHAQILLKAERTALNFLSYLSEIATHTARTLRGLSEAPETFRGLLDTRKGRPGLLFFEKYGVRTGGGKNHRLGFFDGDLIKDNDIAAAGSIPAAIDRKWNLRYMVEIQIEVDSLETLDEVIEDGRVSMILLDNMDFGTLREAVARARRRKTAARTGKPYILEASGVRGMELGKVAGSGVDYISTSALVRSAPPLDMNMKIVRVFR